MGNGNCIAPLLLIHSENQCIIVMSLGCTPLGKIIKIIIIVIVIVILHYNSVMVGMKKRPLNNRIKIRHKKRRDVWTKKTTII